MSTTLPAPDTDELERLSNLPTELALQRAVPFLAHLVSDSAFLDALALPLLKQAGTAEDWYVAHTYDGQDGSYSLQVFVWPPRTRTQIHDHTSWGAYCCVVGSVLEERYERLDDGSRLNHARLKKLWQLSWSRGDGVSTVLPYDEGIHRVGNLGSKTAISVHLYGPQKGEFDGRDYDASRDYVCDRTEARQSPKPQPLSTRVRASGSNPEWEFSESSALLTGAVAPELLWRRAGLASLSSACRYSLAAVA
ncbi:MAG: cysteine dioxygenase family protein [Chloroflexota bacterium]|nr:cysteine dioxygenase family protein [Chloroflexota bacterium]